MKRTLILNLCSGFLSLLTAGSLLADDGARKLTSADRQEIAHGAAHPYPHLGGGLARLA